MLELASFAFAPLSLYGRGAGEEGAHSCKYHFQHRIAVPKNLVVPEPQNREALILQPGIAPCILPALVVLPTISFNYQPRPKVHEVHYIWPQRLLSAEFLTQQSMCPKVAP